MLFYFIKVRCKKQDERRVINISNTKEKDWTGDTNSVFKALKESNHTNKERENDDFYATDPIAINALLEDGGEDSGRLQLLQLHGNNGRRKNVGGVNMNRYIASVSFGKDSLAMLLLLIAKKYPLDEVVFYDTGKEFQAIYNLRDKIVPMLLKLGIKYTELTPQKSFDYQMFELPIIRNSERSCERCKHYKLLSLSWGCCNNPASKFYQKHDEHGGGLPSEKSPDGKGSCKLLELKEYTKFGFSWCGGPCRWGTGEKLKAIEKHCKGAYEYVGIASDETARLVKERSGNKLFLLAV